MKRVASLLPSATDIVGALGLESWLVGVSHECDWSPYVAGLPRLTRSLIGTNLPPAAVDALVNQSRHAHRSLYVLDSAELERLKPEVILTQELCEVCAVSYDEVLGAARLLRQGGGSPSILSLEPRNLAEVLQTVQIVADALDERERGTRLVTDLRGRVEELRRRGDRLRPKRSVLVLEWPDPPFVGGHWVPDLIDAAGGVSVPLQEARRNLPSVRVTWEAIGASDPDLIVVAPCGYDRTKAAGAISQLASSPEWRALRAVRSSQVFPVDANVGFSRPGPRLIEGIRELQEILERYDR